MVKRRKIWVFSPPKQAKPKLPNTLKANVIAEANDLINTVLKPTHVKPPAVKEESNKSNEPALISLTGRLVGYLNHWVGGLKEYGSD